ncbi:MAG TPA: UDP-N-acetylmuramoyl-L-alanyl-D-glutamate--2,6-diaminopimelate ligase [Myxococcota bacterium]|nr:UDP-N-acetylmuramoyl-L-alanyl-D-glutamate--2,6-diaminopimelate ligase [Myxococcota bacterium]
MNLTRLFEDQDVRIDGGDVEVSALAYDSRRVVSGSLFAAIPGAKSDGHDFIAKALASGATSILCEREVDTGSVTRVIAADSRRALALAAKRFYGSPSDQLTMVGVTGTNGKTTTSYLVAALLESVGLPTGVVGTLGVRLGATTIDTGLTTPESLELQQAFASMRDQGAKAVSMEVSSHALAQGRVAGVAFDVGVFTNLTHDHLDFHGTIDNYFEAKAELFRSHLKVVGRAVINVDDGYGAGLAKELLQAGRDVITVSPSGRPADLSAKDVQLALTGIRFTVERSGKPLKVDSPLVGRFNVENLLLAIGVARALGVPDATTLSAIRNRGVVPGRLERAGGGTGPVVLVDYAHTPDALVKALSTVRELTHGKLICVFGCGGDRDAKKRAPMGEAAGKGADFSIITNDNPRTEDPKRIAAQIEEGMKKSGGSYTVELDRAAAIELAIGKAANEDAVLIAGKGHENYQIVGTEKRDFDDREAAKSALAKIAQTPSHPGDHRE